MKNKYKHSAISLPLKMAIVLLGSGILFCFFHYLCKATGILLYDIASDICLLVFLQMLITHICAPIVLLVFRKKFNYNNLWFSEKDFERGLYKVLGVKKWKGKFPTYEENQVSLYVHSMEMVIANMCHAEIVHEFIAVCSFIPIILHPYINNMLLIISSVLFFVIHMIFAIIQRYNRPRLIKIMKRNQNLNRYN